MNLIVMMLVTKTDVAIKPKILKPKLFPKMSKTKIPIRAQLKWFRHSGLFYAALYMHRYNIKYVINCIINTGQRQSSLSTPPFSNSFCSHSRFCTENIQRRTGETQSILLAKLVFDSIAYLELEKNEFLGHVMLKV